MQFTEAECACHFGVRYPPVSTFHPPTQLNEAPDQTIKIEREFTVYNQILF